ncbi:hypothetical protein ULMS_10460 [Patiriisocius marinistellae]|uniref:GDYXXLXY domain-containing protein n=1 Tax=Patiriisocius marinistellae TaxID=2494560 RepID=A0A5J4FWC2_9FLAO|nr:GDYXXLXY domain-containing protein [Patiriisocius marinistellae]GEQ85538.1 hypothetical protein ULMS_10460 [Patiriisocius marinistellae]
MNKLLTPIILVALFAAQWFIPAQMIYQQEAVLTEGTPYKFKTIPIDPSDPLRGKYIVLNYEMNKLKITDSSLFNVDEFYVYIENDTNGFAQATHASAQKMDNMQDYIKVDSGYFYEDTIHFQLPFNRFYMEESKAYEAEVYVRNATRDTLPLNCYGLVYIKEGQAILKNVIVDEISIKDYVLKNRTE